MTQRRSRVARFTGSLAEQDPGKPPRPLVETVEGKRGAGYNFREGGRMVLRGRGTYKPGSVFALALVGSAILNGQPLRCRGFMPGISLRITVSNHPSTRQIPADAFSLRLWQATQPAFDVWFGRLEQSPTITLEFEAGGVVVQFARDKLFSLRPGVMEIEVQD